MILLKNMTWKKMIAIYLKATEVLMKIHESAKYKWQTAWY